MHARCVPTDLKIGATWRDHGGMAPPTSVLMTATCGATALHRSAPVVRNRDRATSPGIRTLRRAAADAPAARSAPSAGIRRASAEASRARDEALARLVRERQRRRAVRAVDELVDALEDLNLSGRGRQTTALMPGWLRRLELEACRPLPPRVSQARNPVRLHAALLDWQEELLDEAVPGRALYALVDHDFWTVEASPGVSQLEAVMSDWVLAARRHLDSERDRPPTAEHTARHRPQSREDPRQALTAPPLAS